MKHPAMFRHFFGLNRSSLFLGVFLSAMFLISASTALADVIVYTGYYDLTPAQFPPGLPVPDPWSGSPNTTFYGPAFNPSDPDVDGVRILNTGPNTVTVQSLTIGPYDLFLQAGLVGPVTILPGKNAVFEGVDGSDLLGGGTLVTFSLDNVIHSFTDPTGPGYPHGALHGNETFGNTDESAPWTQGADVPSGSATPEPASITLLVGMGLACLAVYGWRRRYAETIGFWRSAASNA